MARDTFEHDLHEVETALVQMHTAVDRALTQALRAFDQAYRTSAQSLIIGDADINERRSTVEEAALRLIARQQPLTRDLRLCIAAIAIAADLERIGDYAVGIAKLVLRDSLDRPLLPEVHLLATEVRGLLQRSITAIVARDATAGDALARADDSVDAQYEALLRQSSTLIAQDPGRSRHLLYTLFVAHNLERIADRAVNIAERAAWIATGRRHK